MAEWPTCDVCEQEVRYSSCQQDVTEAVEAIVLAAHRQHGCTGRPEQAETGYPLEGDDGGCCAREPHHDGPCEWDCSDCDGTGRCPVCEEECHCDDVVTCEYCDGTHACFRCLDGRIVDE
jgi:hypothetical protein